MPASLEHELSGRGTPLTTARAASSTSLPQTAPSDQINVTGRTFALPVT
jgi:hypothetical protein